MSNESGSFTGRKSSVVSILLFSLVGATAFIWLVRNGVLYGTGPVTAGAGIVAGLLLISVGSACWLWPREPGRRRSRRRPTTSKDDNPPPSTATAGDWVALAAGILGVVALVASLLTFMAPVTPRQLSVTACPGARTWNVAYSAITFSEGGNNGRTGPAVSYPSNKRFPASCAVGFTGYCLGDSVQDTLISGDHVKWVNNRWLRLAKHEPGSWASWLAARLSGEQPEPTYIADSLMTPAAPYNSIQLADDCPAPAYPKPQKTTLEPFFVGTNDTGAEVQQLTARSRYAPNLGIGIWYPNDDVLTNAGTYDQIFNPNGVPADNPGMTNSAGEKTVTWPYQKTTQKVVQEGSTANVVVLAIGCLAPNVPAHVDTADIAIYQVTATDIPVPAIGADIPVDLDRERLARTACRSML